MKEECEYCNGKGQVNFAELYPNSDLENKVTVCKGCKGTGYIDRDACTHYERRYEAEPDELYEEYGLSEEEIYKRKYVICRDCGKLLFRRNGKFVDYFKTREAKARGWVVE